MKIKNIKIFSWLLMLVTLAVTSCRDDTFSDYWDNSDEFTVTLDVELEGMNVATREGDEPERKREIGNGSMIDMLVYAVYYDADKNPQNPRWEAAMEYVKEEDPAVAIEKAFPKDHDKVKVTLGHGQTVVNVSGTLDKGKKHPITLTLKKGENYRVVFWAQNHLTEAFVIDDLKRVQMKYKVLHEKESGMTDTDGNPLYTDNIQSVNNDEARDAFCRSVALSGDQAKKNITIYLKRPLAQINVGTRGFDYESITRNSEEGKKFLYSKIRINRAARYLNVVTDQIYTTTTEIDDTESSTEAFYTIDYEYNRIPAYWKWEEGKVPEYPSYTIYDHKNETGAYDSFFKVHTDFGITNSDPEDTKEKKFYELYGEEEFLKVHLYKDEDIVNEKKDEDGYVTYSSMGNSMDTSKEEDLDHSEVFKYLSMCYVLTNSSDEYQDVLTNVKVWMATSEHPTGNGDEVEVANIAQVPVQRNHRTNIVGSLLTAKASMQIIVDDDFAGRKINGNAGVKSGEIAEGFYYDAEKDEFQISSVNGLVFFQQLVNGDLTVRQITNEKEGVNLNEPYPYIKYGADDANDIARLKYNSWSYDKLGPEQAEILRKALKLHTYNKGNTSDSYLGRKFSLSIGDNKKLSVLMDDEGRWPYFNNFSFYGATVKLMADIDLSGIEWIPIGFDCCSWDSSISNNQGFQADQQVNTTNYRTLVTVSNNSLSVNLDHRRVFCGTFDGNGHTIYNLTTKKFGTRVLDYSQQKEGKKTNPSLNDGPYDNVQWFGRGFFGLCGPGVEIKNLRLQNVDVQGNNGVAALVAVVNSVGFPAKIYNCIVDGGYVTAVPLYRNDFNEKNYKGRTVARGVYVSGIVGQFCAGDDSYVTNCEVRNLTIQGFRRMGGIIGSIADQSNSNSLVNKNIRLDIKVEDNSVFNTLIVCNQYVPFDYFWNTEDKGIWKSGFGWGAATSTSPMSDRIVGGKYEVEDYDAFSGNVYQLGGISSSKDDYYGRYIPSKNRAENVQYSILAVTPSTKESDFTGAAAGTVRESKIGNIPLLYIPMFSSLFVDEVDLTYNYYGETDIKTKIDFNNTTQLWVGTDGVNNKFIFPISFPYHEVVDYSKSSDAFAGMYVETVYITGENAPGGRSVITPSGVDGINSCVMYITARDRKQFENNLDGNKSSPANKTLNKTTTIKDVVLRGSPYAWAGVILAPNENMDKVVLKNVTIYDVYKTLALEEVEKKENLNIQTIQNKTYWGKYKNDKSGKVKTDQGDAAIDLDITDCNLRGYTVPGKGWNKINYTKTTFEAGSETKYSNESMSDNLKNEYKTCKMESPTVFTDCYFKAPYYLDLSGIDNSKVKFSNCWATSAYNNVLIEPASIEKITGKTVTYVRIEKNIMLGKTIVWYYMSDGKIYDSNGEEVKEEV